MDRGKEPATPTYCTVGSAQRQETPDPTVGGCKSRGLTSLLKQPCSLHATAGDNAVVVCSSLASALDSKGSNSEEAGILLTGSSGNVSNAGAHNLLVRIFSRLSRRTSATPPVLS